MSLKLAFKAFFKALKAPKTAQFFLEEKRDSEKKKAEATHLQLLSLMQTKGRLIDFLQEDLSSLSDADIGAAMRPIHRDLARVVDELVAIRPLLPEEEGEKIILPQGYDPSLYKVTGKVKGEPPYKGIVRHRGWKAHKLSLPKTHVDLKREVVCPAEIEVV